MKKLFCALLLVFLTTVLHAETEPMTWWESTKNGVRDAWFVGEYGLILPVNTYHSRLTYDRANIKRYNEMPWGFGLERLHTDASGNRHSLYAVAFSASYKYVQPVAGYSWEKQFYWDGLHSARAGLGWSAFITARKQQNYIPFPGVLPVVSAGYRSISLQTSWVPYGGRNFGNVFLTVIKINV